MKGYWVIHRIIEKFRKPSTDLSSQELYPNTYLRNDLIKKGQIREEMLSNLYICLLTLQAMFFVGVSERKT